MRTPSQSEGGTIMKQSIIDRCVARITGESRRTISRYGFSLLEDEPAGEADDVSIAVECGGCGRIVRLAAAQYHADEPEAVCVGCDAIYPVTADELFAIDTPLGRLAPCA
jgi:hypothetical protein